MKVKILITSLLFLAVCFAACSGSSKKDGKPLCDEWKQPDSIAYNQLGKSLATVLFQPKDVKCYHLVGKETIGEDEMQIEPGFVRDTMLAKLDKEEYSLLQFSLLSVGKNYERDSVVVMSPYVPCLEFEFSRKKETAHVIISLSDFSWTVVYDDKRQFNFNYIDTPTMEQFCKYYLSKLNTKNNK